MLEDGDGDDPQPGESLLEYRVREVVRQVRGLQGHTVTKEWLEQRLGRIDDALANLRGEVHAMKESERQRRVGTYVAVVSAVLSLVAALVLAAVTTGVVG